MSDLPEPYQIFAFPGEDGEIEDVIISRNILKRFSSMTKFIRVDIDHRQGGFIENSLTNNSIEFPKKDPHYRVYDTFDLEVPYLRSINFDIKNSLLTFFSYTRDLKDPISDSIYASQTLNIFPNYVDIRYMSDYLSFIWESDSGFKVIDSTKKVSNLEISLNLDGCGGFSSLEMEIS